MATPGKINCETLCEEAWNSSSAANRVADALLLAIYRREFEREQMRLGPKSDFFLA